MTTGHTDIELFSKAVSLKPGMALLIDRDGELYAGEAIGFERREDDDSSTLENVVATSANYHFIDLIPDMYTQQYKARIITIDEISITIYEEE